MCQKSFNSIDVSTYYKQKQKLVSFNLATLYFLIVQMYTLIVQFVAA